MKRSGLFVTSLLLCSILIAALLQAQQHADALDAATFTDKTTLTSLTSGRWKQVYTDSLGKTYFLDTSGNSFKSVRINADGTTNSTVTAVLAASTVSAISPVEEVAGVKRVYVAQPTATNTANIYIINIDSGAIISTTTDTLSSALSSLGATTAIAVTTTKNKVWVGIGINVGASNNDLSMYTDNKSPSGTLTFIATDTTGAGSVGEAACVPSVNGAAYANDIVYCAERRASEVVVSKWTSAGVTSLGTLSGATASEYPELTVLSDKAILRFTQSTGPTERTYTITKSTDAVTLAFSDNWNTLNGQLYDFDGTTMTFKSGARAYLANSGTVIAYYATDGELQQPDSCYAESVSNATSEITCIDDSLFYRISDSLAVSGSGTTWTPRAISGNTVSPTMYTERLGTPLFENYTMITQGLVIMVCDANYPIPGKLLIVGTDSDCESWRVIDTTDSDSGRIISYSRTASLVHASEYTNYQIHLSAADPSAIRATIKYEGVSVDANSFDAADNTQLRMLYGQCYDLVYTEILSGDVEQTDTLCADDVIFKDAILSTTLGFLFWSSTWGVNHEYNSTSAILDTQVHHRTAPYNYTINVLNNSGLAVVNQTISSPDELDLQTYNLTAYTSDGPLKLEVYSQDGKRIYQTYLDSRPKFLKDVAALADSSIGTFEGFSLIMLIPLGFAGIYTRNTAGIGALLFFASICAVNWFGGLEIPEPAMWLMGIIALLASLAYYYFTR